MDVGQISVATAATAAIVKELQNITEMQMAVMKSLSDSQQQMAEMLRAAGIGGNLDILA